MRTSLRNIKETDDHLHGQLPPQDALLFEARLLLDAELANNLHWHQQTLGLVHQYGRNHLRSIIENVHQQLFTQTQHSGFRQKILQLFK
ncbi:hypothetical protein [Mucilaginibacter glaciei]|uniref:Uncharacterized protein n=1 Tax=Mucilaginibacter glaciei TaxID=2772109 RepID=A0A926S0V3_9SPHI|nr:hypothetical protein [Mucilaginibacter glaciei]MBD1391509.1 hypothetical protein [Mucilaginibacter glaciei]